MSKLGNLSSEKVFQYFEEICSIPHGSGNEKMLSDFLVDFARERNLYYRQDEKCNVVIKKEGSLGYERVQAVILQAHLDMVCQKNKGTKKDFLTEGIHLVVEGDFISAKGTTLGADNGIAVAYMMTLLDDTSLCHPPIEAVFTVEEETGLGGANFFDPFDLTGKRFINLDTEEEGVLLSGCSGGRRVEISLPISRQEAEVGKRAYGIFVGGLKGGHSGADIHLQRANANVLMGRILFSLAEGVEYDLVQVDGGTVDNAICREAESIILMKEDQVETGRGILAQLEKTFQEEYNTQDPSITIRMMLLQEEVFQVLTQEEKKTVVDLLYLLPYGVQSMCMDMEGLVESSSNMGILETTPTHIRIDNALRSSVESRKELLSEKIQVIANRCGCEFKICSDYPGWKYNPDSPLLHHFAKVYETLAGKPPIITAIHAGLECGIFGKKMQGLDMVSLGPEMYDVHTPDERVSISSTLRVWAYLKEVLAKMDH